MQHVRLARLRSEVGMGHCLIFCREKLPFVLDACVVNEFDNEVEIFGYGLHIKS